MIEAQSDGPKPYGTLSSGWVKRIKFALISLPVWTGLSLYLLVNFLKK